MGNSPVLVDGIEETRKGWVLVVSSRGSWLLRERVVNELGLREGSSLVPAEMDELASKQQMSAARRDLQRYLAGAEHTREQLRHYLEGRLYHTGVIDDLIEWAVDTGLVDDLRYAEAFIRSHSGRSPMGNFRMRLELGKRGVPSEITDELLSERDEEELFGDLVREVRSKYGRLERTRAFRRASGYLQRRGFAYDLVRRVLGSALDDRREAGD